MSSNFLSCFESFNPCYLLEYFLPFFCSVLHFFPGFGWHHVASVLPLADFPTASQRLVNLDKVGRHGALNGGELFLLRSKRPEHTDDRVEFHRAVPVLQRRNVRSALSCSRGVRRLRFLLSIMRSI